MNATHRSSSHLLRLLAVLAIPVLLMLHAPVLAALVPGALLTIASLEHDDAPRSLPATQLVLADDAHELQRLAAATPITGSSRRIA